MQRWYGLGEVSATVPPAVVTIGVFDGVHLGHRELIRSAIRWAEQHELPATAITFDPNPAEVLGRGTPPRRLATLEQRLRLIEELGIDSCLVLHFDVEFAGMSAEAFVTDVLVARLHVAHIVVGENFRFGHFARGDVATLARLGVDLGFTVTPHALLAASPTGAPVSSTLIRSQVADGDVAAAMQCLARPHRVEGIVVEGSKRGHDLGFPTANLEPTELAAIPADGVYAGRLVVDPYGSDPRAFPAAVSIGTNPTFGDEGRRCEAHALGESDLDLYGCTVAIDFVARLRDQQAFAGTDELVSAMRDDVARTRELMGD